MTEKYSPQKHEWGTPESAEWAKSMTPGQEGSIGIPAGKASMKFKDVRPKKDQVKETISGKSFFEYRKELSEEISHRRMSKKINYEGTPKRPQRRVSMPTRKLLATMQPLTNRRDAQKEKSSYRRAKELWGSLLPSIRDAGALYIRELKIKGGYKYFFSFDEVLPHFTATSEKKIPKKDLEFIIPEFEYMTYAAFGRKWSAPDKESVDAAIAGGPPGTDPDYVPKQWKPEKIGPSYNMKGSSNQEFTISNYHKKSFSQSYLYSHPEDDSIIRISHAFRFGSAEVSAPSLKELITKIEKDGGFNSEKWDDFDFEYGEDGGHGSELEILQGPKGIRPGTDAYEEWEEKVEYASEDELDKLGYDYYDDDGYEIHGPIKIEDERNNVYVFDPEMVASPEDDEKHIISADEIIFTERKDVPESAVEMFQGEQELSYERGPGFEDGEMLMAEYLKKYSFLSEASSEFYDMLGEAFPWAAHGIGDYLSNLQNFEVFAEVKFPTYEGEDLEAYTFRYVDLAKEAPEILEFTQVKRFLIICENEFVYYNTSTLPKKEELEKAANYLVSERKDFDDNPLKEPAKPFSEKIDTKKLPEIDKETMTKFIMDASENGNYEAFILPIQNLLYTCTSTDEIWDKWAEDFGGNYGPDDIDRDWEDPDEPSYDDYVEGRADNALEELFAQMKKVGKVKFKDYSVFVFQAKNVSFSGNSMINGEDVVMFYETSKPKELREGWIAKSYFNKKELEALEEYGQYNEIWYMSENGEFD